jgi:hypothetical protein
VCVWLGSGVCPSSRGEFWCRCHARLSATILACYCFEQFAFVNEHLERVFANLHTQHRATHGAGLRTVERLYCCVFDLDHSVCLLRVVVVSHVCIIPSALSVVNPTCPTDVVLRLKYQS